MAARQAAGDRPSCSHLGRVVRMTAAYKDRRRRYEDGREHVEEFAGGEGVVIG